MLQLNDLNTEKEIEYYCVKKRCSIKSRILTDYLKDMIVAISSISLDRWYENKP